MGNHHQHPFRDKTKLTEMLGLAKCGVPNSSLATKYECTPKTIRYHLQRNNVVYVPPPKVRKKRDNSKYIIPKMGYTKFEHVDEWGSPVREGKNYADYLAWDLAKRKKVREEYEKKNLRTA